MKIESDPHGNECGPMCAGLRRNEEQTRIARSMGRVEQCEQADYDAAHYGRCAETGQRDAWE